MESRCGIDTLIVLEYQYSHVGKEESCSLATGKVNIPNACFYSIKMPSVEPQVVG